MKIVSIDVETSGLDPKINQLLSVGIVIEDTKKQLSYEEIPKLEIAIIQHEITGHPYALTLNSELIKDINTYMRINDVDKRLKFETHTGREPKDVVQVIYSFLYVNDIIEKESSDLLGKTITYNGVSTPNVGSVKKHSYFNVAGKNFEGLDGPFLEILPRWKQVFKYRKRIFDPGILFVNWDMDDQIPGLNECKIRASIEGEVTHRALDDAWDVVLLLRKHINSSLTDFNSKIIGSKTYDKPAKIN
jgi:hypothetical protein